jgi:hypothetical protein
MKIVILVVRYRFTLTQAGLHEFRWRDMMKFIGVNSEEPVAGSQFPPGEVEKV